MFEYLFLSRKDLADIIPVKDYLCEMQFYLIHDPFEHILIGDMLEDEYR